MKRLAILACAAVLAATPVVADEKPTDEEAAKIKAALAAWGCEGGAYEKETEATGVYEIDDAKCKDGRQYDLKLDKDFNLLSITAD